MATQWGKNTVADSKVYLVVTPKVLAPSIASNITHHVRCYYFLNGGFFFSPRYLLIRSRNVYYLKMYFMFCKCASSFMKHLIADLRLKLFS